MHRALSFPPSQLVNAGQHWDKKQRPPSPQFRPQAPQFDGSELETMHSAPQQKPAELPATHASSVVEGLQDA